MNVVISDMKSTPMEFVSSLETTTQMKWMAINWQSNQLRTSKVSEVKRYLKYIFMPLLIVFRKDLKNICAWQQFYGICYAFWSRFFHRPKTARLTVMTFIYKPRDGLMGRLYSSFIHFAVSSCYIDRLVCTSSDACKRYAELFGIDRCKFVFSPIGIPDEWGAHPINSEADNGYLIDVGRSNRDHASLVEAVRGTKWAAKIIDDTYHADVPANVEVFNNMRGRAMLDCLANAWAVVIPLENPDMPSGQTVLLQAWSFCKPVICTRGEGLSDYVADGVDCLAVGRNPAEIYAALGQLRDEHGLYERLVKNGRKKYEENYGLKALGERIGRTFLDNREVG